MQSLFLYTSLASFLAIIQSRKIRFCELTKSNDRLEGRFISDSLSEYMIYQNVPNYIRNCVFHILNRFIDMYAYYGFCMTSEGDDLGQWRAYADHGQGIALGFDLDKLIECANKSPLWRGTKISVVKYGKNSILPYAEDLLRVVREIAAKSDDSFWAEPEKLFRDHSGKGTHLCKAVEEFSKICYDVKNPSFSMEKETRITQETTFTWSKGASFFERNGQIVTYYDVEFTSEAISSVTVGPNLNIDVNDVRRVLTSWDGPWLSRTIYKSISSVRL